MAAFGVGDRKEVRELFRFHSGPDLASPGLSCLFINRASMRPFPPLLPSPPLTLTVSEVNLEDKSFSNCRRGCHKKRRGDSGAGILVFALC